MNRKGIWWHIAGWVGLYLLWIGLFRHRALVLSHTMTVEFCYLVFVAANYYFHTLFTIPRLLYKEKYAAFAVLFAAAVAVSALLRVPLVLYLNRHAFAPGAPSPEPLSTWLNSMLNILVWTVGLVAVKLVTDKTRLRQYLEKVEKEQVENELALLKAQLNPHFLFNSINSIYGHIDKSNAAARTMLIRFSEMLRYQLYECNTERVVIDKEISYIRNYISLQQARKGDNLVVCLDIRDAVKGCSIAPLLFISFIENAFKYASTGELRENRVEVQLDKKEDKLIFRTFNTKDVTGPPPTHKGIGIANVQRRLELLYPRRHQLVLKNGDDFFEVKLTIQV